MRKKGSVLIAMGLLLLAAALLLTAYNIWDGRRADRVAQSVLQSLRTQVPGMTSNGALADIPQPAAPAEETPEDTGTAQPSEPTDPTVPGQREMPTVEVGGYRYIGELDVPSLELSLPVMEDWDYERLKTAPCRYSGSVYEDDLVICAHNYPTHFSPLKYAPIGTQVKFTDAEGTEFYYTVASIETVGPSDVEGLLSGDWDLTLFTCNTGGQTRCAIRCQRVTST